MNDEGGTGLPLDTYRLLVEEALTGMYLIKDERLVYANTRLADIFGYSRQEMLELATVLHVIAESDRELVREMLRQRMAGEIDRIEYTVRGVRKDGEIIYLDVRSSRTTHDGHPAVMGSMLDITSYKQLEDALRNLSLVDDLTGLYNRRGFTTLAERHLSLARRHHRELLLLFADLDSLKQINDTHGHPEGDQALVDVAGVLRNTFRSADIIARLGGDEFTVFPLEAATESGDRLIERLRANLVTFNREHRRPYQLSLSVGIGRYDPSKCQSIQQLLAEADRELYERKRGRPADEPAP